MNEQQRYTCRNEKKRLGLGCVDSLPRTDVVSLSLLSHVCNAHVEEMACTRTLALGVAAAAAAAVNGLPF